MSETVIRKHAIGCLPKILRTRTILCINIHIQFKWHFLIWADNALTRIHRLSNKNPNTRYEKPSSELLVTVVQETPNITDCCYCPWLPPQRWKVSPYWWRHHALRHRAQRSLSWNWPESPPWGLALMMLEGIMQVSHGRKQPIVLPSYGTYEPPQPAWHSSPKGVVVAHIPQW